MSTTPEQIDVWRAAPTERQRLEFKEAKTQFDNKKLYKYCVALANEGGGQLILGGCRRTAAPSGRDGGVQHPGSYGREAV